VTLSDLRKRQTERRLGGKNGEKGRKKVNQRFSTNWGIRNQGKQYVRGGKVERSTGNPVGGKGRKKGFGWGRDFERAAFPKNAKGQGGRPGPEGGEGKKIKPWKKGKRLRGLHTPGVEQGSLINGGLERLWKGGDQWENCIIWESKGGGKEGGERTGRGR